MSHFEDFIYSISDSDSISLSKTMKDDFVNKLYKHSELKHGIIQAEILAKHGHKHVRPIHLACDRGNLEIIGTLLSSECDLNVYTKTGNHPIHIAAARGHWEVVVLLLKEVSVIDIVNKKNQTPLHFAAKNGHLKVAKILLFAGSNPAVADVTNARAFDLARSHGNEALATAIGEWTKLIASLKEMQGGRFRQMQKHPNFKKFYINNDVCIEAMLCYMKEVSRSKSLEQVINDLRFYHYIRHHQNDDYLMRADIEAINQIIDQDSALEYCLNHTDSCPYFLNNLITLILDMDKMEENLQRIRKIVIKLPNKNLMRITAKRLDFIRIKRKAKWNRLHLAVNDHRNDMIEYLLLKRLVNINDPDEMGNTPLFLACIFGRSECANILMNHGADVNTKNKYGQSLLQISIENGMVDFVMPILDTFQCVETIDSLGHSALVVAIKYGSDDLLEKLIPKFKNLDNEISDLTALTYQSCRSYENLLFTISSKENLASLCLKVRGYIYPTLISRMSSQSLQILDENNNSLLHLSAWNLADETCQHLIDRGADVNSVNADGNTPLHEAVNRYLFDGPAYNEVKLLSTVKILIRASASINILNTQRQTPLQLALQCINEKLIKELMKEALFFEVECADFEYLLSGKHFCLLTEIMPKIPRTLLSKILTEEFMKKCIKEIDIPTTRLLFRMVSLDIRKCILKEILHLHELHKDRICFLQALMDCESSFCEILDGETLLTYLLKNGEIELCKDLISSPFVASFIEGVNLDNQTCLHVSAEIGNFLIMERISKYSNLCDEKDDNGDSALGLLLKYWSSDEHVENRCIITKLAKILIRGGADIYIKNNNCDIAIDMCKNEMLKKKLIDFHKSCKKKIKSYLGPHHYMQDRDHNKP